MLGIRTLCLCCEQYIMNKALGVQSCYSLLIVQKPTTVLKCKTLLQESRAFILYIYYIYCLQNARIRPRLHLYVVTYPCQYYLPSMQGKITDTMTIMIRVVGLMVRCFLFL